MEDKNIIRKRILNIRNELGQDTVETLSKIILEKFVSQKEYKNSNTILTYMSFKNEVDTLNLVNRMFEDGKRVIIPYTNIEDVEIVPVEIKNLHDDLTLSKYGYLEPIKEKLKPVDITEIDLIIVPGVVFDTKLNRIGFGKGYYDRFLCKRRQNVEAIAFAYQFQILDQIPYGEFDIKMDKIITEKMTYKSPVFK